LAGFLPAGLSGVSAWAAMETAPSAPVAVALMPLTTLEATDFVCRGLAPAFEDLEAVAALALAAGFFAAVDFLAAGFFAAAVFLAAGFAADFAAVFFAAVFFAAGFLAAADLVAAGFAAALAAGFFTVLAAVFFLAAVDLLADFTAAALAAAGLAAALVLPVLVASFDRAAIAAPAPELALPALRDFAAGFLAIANRSLLARCDYPPKANEYKWFRFRFDFDPAKHSGLFS
jgi:hypothetical protein